MPRKRNHFALKLAQVALVLEYEGGVGCLTVTADGEPQPFIVAEDLPPGCILYVGACSGKVSVVGGGTTLDAPIIKSARKV
jgi:hypothetical protein